MGSRRRQLYPDGVTQDWESVEYPQAAFLTQELGERDPEGKKGMKKRGERIECFLPCERDKTEESCDFGVN